MLRVLLWPFLLANALVVGALSSDDLERALREEVGRVTPALIESFASASAQLNSNPPERDFELFQKTRRVQGFRECGQTIGYATTADILTVVSTFLDTALNPADPQLAPTNALLKGAFSQSLKFGIRASVICSTCEEIVDLYGDEILSDDGEDSFASYCGKDRLGYSTLYSGLLLEPIDPATGELRVGKLKGAVWGKETSARVEYAMSLLWPENILDIIDKSEDPNIPDIVTQYWHFGHMMTTAAGAISVVADYPGYGLDAFGLKGAYVKATYQRSTIPLVLSAQELIKSNTGGCSEFMNFVSVSGYSEGAVAAVSAAGAFGKLGFGIGVLQAGAVPARFSTVHFLKTTDNVDKGLWPNVLRYALPLQGNSYSSTNPDLPNTNVGQDLLSEEWMDPNDDSKNIPLWWRTISDRDLINNELLPEYLLSIFDPDIVEWALAAVRENNFAACTNNVTVGFNDKYCEALELMDIVTILESATYPTIVCMSPDDVVVDIRNAPDYSVNPFLSEFNLFPVSGSHFEAYFPCFLGQALTFWTTPALTDASPPDDETCIPDCCMESISDPPSFLISGLSTKEEEWCAVVKNQKKGLWLKTCDATKTKHHFTYCDCDKTLRPSRFAKLSKCVHVDELKDGERLGVVTCTPGAVEQQFEFTSDGFVSPVSDPTLCMTNASPLAEDRDPIVLQTCAADDDGFVWSLEEI